MSSRATRDSLTSLSRLSCCSRCCSPSVVVLSTAYEFSVRGKGVFLGSFPEFGLRPCRQNAGNKANSCALGANCSSSGLALSAAPGGVTMRQAFLKCSSKLTGWVGRASKEQIEATAKHHRTAIRPAADLWARLVKPDVLRDDRAVSGVELAPVGAKGRPGMLFVRSRASANLCWHTRRAGRITR